MLHSCHDAPSSGHQDVNKTLARLRQEAYWVGMAEDVDVYCRKCIKCQQAKLPTPIHAPMNSIPIGRTWQTIAVDILERYLCLKPTTARYLMELKSSCFELNFQAACQIQQPVSTKQRMWRLRFEYSFMT